MKQKEQMDKMKQLLNAISKTIAELEKGDNLSFFKSLLQKQSIELYEYAETITAEGKSATPPHIKIVKQEEVLEASKSPEPAIVPEPEIEKVSLKPVSNTPAEPKIEIPESAIIPPPVEIKTEVVIEPPAPLPVVEKPAPVIETPVEEKTKAPVTPPSPPAPPVSKSQEPVTTSLVDKKISDDVSLNAKLSMNKQPVVNIAEKSKETPITDLAKAISISKKFEFIKGLFEGDGESYKTAISALQQSASYQDAINYLDTQVRSRYDWSDNEDLSKELLTLLKRRFMN
ncbi:MAG: hypothetical protein ACKOXF_04650 [Chitinophagaceae bacterium]